MSDAMEKALRFTRIRLENWRNFRHVEIDLQGRVFLVGPNASGKSNFLDAFRFLRDIARHPGFQQAVWLRGGVSRLRNFSAPEDSDVAVAVSIGSDDQPDLWQYEVRFREDPAGRPVLTAERVRREGFEMNRPDGDDRQDPARLTQTALEQVSLNKDFREIAEFLSRVFYLHVVPQLVREPERSAGRSADPFGGDFLEQVADLPPDLLQERLNWVTGVLQAAVPQLQKFDVQRDGRGQAHLRAQYRPSGRWQTEEDFSDGTLRLFGLLWAHLSQPAGPLILEEPELSLHPEVVSRLGQVFALMSQEGQVLLSTHSPDLLRDEGIGLDEVLLLLPGDQGTDVRSAASFPEIVALLEGDVPLADAVLPQTSPQGVEQFVRRAGH
ncbi:MAG TPA: AAA family ATPase [Thermoanaerobaculia bacterium]|nr:AAA family ATPase [Thermoanaerobaculia bacterium]